MKPETEDARPKPAVCRRLFADEGPGDEGLQDNMFNQLAEEIGRKLDDASKKYNFDFRTEQPLEGDWTWERLTPEGEAEGEEPPTTAPEESEGTHTPSRPKDPQDPPTDPSTVPQ